MAARLRAIDNETRIASGNPAVPDESEEVEALALSCMILHRRACYEAMIYPLTREHFTSQKHRLLFDVATAAYEEGESGEVGLIFHRMEQAGRAQSYSLVDLLSVFELAPTSTMIRVYAQRLEELRLRRARRERLVHAYDLLRSGDEDGAESALREALEVPRLDKAIESQDLQVERLAEELKAEPESGVVGLPTGFSRLNRATWGLTPATYWLILGQTSAGKTTLVLQILLAAAMAGGAVYIWSKEMNRLKLQRRLLRMLSGVELRPGGWNKLTPEQRARVESALAELKQLPITIDDRASDLPQMVAQARRLAGKIRVFCVDHIGLVDHPKLTGTEALDKASTAIRNVICNEAEATCLVIGQYDKASSTEARPSMAGVRGSARLIQDPDIVLQLSREELLITKGRDTGCGSIKLEWDARLVKYNEAML